VIIEGIKRLIKKEDLLLWPRGADLANPHIYDLSVSINPAHLDKLERYLERYLKRHPYKKERYLLERVKELEKEFSKKEFSYV